MKEMENKYISTDKVAALLVRLYADYKYRYGDNEDYAQAVAVAIRMLSD